MVKAYERQSWARTSAANEIGRHCGSDAVMAASSRGDGLHARSTKLSTTFFSPAFSNAIVSLLPSTFTTRP